MSQFFLSDKVLVLDNGKKIEYGHASELLSNPNGLFSLMVNDTGKKSAKFLHDVAFGKLSVSNDFPDIKPKPVKEFADASKATASIEAPLQKSLESLEKVVFDSAGLETFRKSILSIRDVVKELLWDQSQVNDSEQEEVQEQRRLINHYLGSLVAYVQK